MYTNKRVTEMSVLKRTAFVFILLALIFILVLWGFMQNFPGDSIADAASKRLSSQTGINFDIQDFDNINMVATWYPDEPQVQNKSVHNVLIKDDLLYVSYYVYGTRIVDISDPYNPIEVGYYDWYPGQNGLYSGN